jgi:phospholipid-binding lipoprotein MlaA
MFKILVFINIIFFSPNIFAANKNINIFNMNNRENIKEARISDPFIKINRKIYKFNYHIDRYTLKPAAKTYRKITAPWFREAVNNVLSNAYQPLNIVNSLLQGKFKKSGISLSSFVINSTIGVLGVFDPAHNNIKLKKYSNEDLGQTLAYYGVPAGPFLMLPLMGPTSLRNLASRTENILYSSAWDYEDVIIIANTAQTLSMREKLLDPLDNIEQNSLDPYSVIKSSYYQNRINLIENE